MSRVLTVLCLLVISQQYLWAFQDKTEVARINDTPIWSDELLYAFKKNRKPDSPVTQDSLLNYLDRYIDFKLKVMSARAKGTDTLSTFRREYEGYIGQVSKPYMDNLNKLEDLVAEAYERSQFEARASHILLRVPANASPQDTLRIYQKIDSLRQLALDGVDFGLLATKNSEDNAGNRKGDLGWFSVFGMVYPFETGVYNTEKGGVSEIVKTQFGYHLIKVTDRRNARGKVRTSHIFIARSKHSFEEGRALIDEVYDSLQNGGSWNILAQLYTEDQQTKKINGALPMAGIGQLPEEYLAHAFEIEEIGTYTSPVETPYGWHIIRLDARLPLPDLAKAKSQLAEGVRRSGRLQYGEREVLKKLKRQNGFESDPIAVQAAADSLKKYLGETDRIPSYNNQLLFSIGSKKVYTQDFYRHIETNADPNIRSFSLAYEEFENSLVFAYEDSLALIRYPEYRLLLQEYEEGLLLFDIMEKTIWNRALKDSVGLREFFKDHLADYPAPERAVVYEISSRTGIAIKALTTAQDVLSKAPTDIAPKVALKEALSPADYSLLKIVKRISPQNELPIFATGKWSENQLILSERKDKLYWLTEIYEAGSYHLDEIQGRVTADYQDYLEKQWVKSLRKEFKIKVYKKRVASLLPLE